MFNIINIFKNGNNILYKFENQKLNITRIY